MIRSRNDLMDYVAADREAMHIAHDSLWMTLSNPIWRYVKTLRKREYYLNACGHNPYKWVMGKFYGWCLRTLGLKLGFSIPPNCFGKGLCIWHYGTIIIHPNSKIGENAQLNAGVVIGKDDQGNCPKIGNNFMCQPGVKICGDIVLGDNVRCGLNAVVTKSFPDGHCVLAGVPAKKICSIHPKDKSHDAVI